MRDLRSNVPEQDLLCLIKHDWRYRTSRCGCVTVVITRNDAVIDITLRKGILQ